MSSDSLSVKSNRLVSGHWCIVPGPILGPSPDSLNQNHWEWAQPSCCNKPSRRFLKLEFENHWSKLSVRVFFGTKSYDFKV